MLRVHLPKPTKHRTKEALLSLKDFSVQIIFLFAAKVTLKPVSPPLLRDAASSLHCWRGPWAGARFFLPSPVSELNNPSRWQQAGCPRGCHRQRLDIVPAGPSAVVVQAGSWHWESLAALLYQKAPYLPLFVAAVASQKLTLIPRKHICHFKSVSPRDVLLYRNNLFAFLQLSRLLYAAWGKKTLHLSLSDSYFSIWSFLQKFPTRTLLLLLLYIFILPFYTQQNAGPPRATCSHLRPALPSIFNYHFTYLLWLYAESLTLENTLYIALLSLRCWLDWLLSWPWGQDSTQRP